MKAAEALRIDCACGEAMLLPGDYFQTLINQVKHRFEGPEGEAPDMACIVITKAEFLESDPVVWICPGCGREWIATVAYFPPHGFIHTVALGSAAVRTERVAEQTLTKGQVKAWMLQIMPHGVRHYLLHWALEELFADFVANNPSKRGFLEMRLWELMRWSASQLEEGGPDHPYIPGGAT